MAKQTIYNAGIYVRLSQEDMRAGESLSIENQKLILTKYVKEQGWNLVDTYVDDGYARNYTVSITANVDVYSVCRFYVFV